MAIEFLKDATSDVFAFERQHYRVGGTIALPVYGNPAKDKQTVANGGATPVNCRIVRLHAPMELMSIVWNCVKKGAAIAPNPYLFDPNLIFKSGRRSAAVPMDMSGEPGHSWAMSGVYEYHVQSPQDLNSSMPVGITPWEDLISIDDSLIPNTAFLSSLLEKEPLDFQDPVFIPPGP